MPAINHKMRAIVRDGFDRGIPIREIEVLAGATYDSVRTMGHRLGMKHQGYAAARAERIKQPTQQELNWQRARDGARKTLRAKS